MRLRLLSLFLVCVSIFAGCGGETTDNAAETALDTLDIPPGQGALVPEASTPIAYPRMIAGRQVLEVVMSTAGFRPVNIAVTQGVEVVLHFREAEDVTCGALEIPELDVRQEIPASGEVTVTFTPREVGTFEMRCTEGALEGSIVVSS